MPYSFFTSISFAFLILLFACNGQKNNEFKAEKSSNIPSVTDTTSYIEYDKSPQKEKKSDKPEYDSLIYVGLLTRFYDHSDFYLPLYYVNNYTEAAYEEITNSVGNTIFSGKESRRRHIDSGIASKYLDINNLDQILVLDKDQRVIDTLVKQHFEYYEDLIESMFIVSYESNLDNSNYVAISAHALDTSTLEPSPQPFVDSTFIKKIIDTNDFKVSQLYACGSIISYSDTLSFLSFGDYEDGKEFLYLVKNTFPVDSVVNNYVIYELESVPLASEFEMTYLAKCAVPDTDMLWNALLGIDLTRFKFRFYDRNRFKLKTRNKYSENDCIFDNNYYALTSAWLKEARVENFEWIQKINAAKIPWNKDTLFVSQGGCYHLTYSLKLKHYNNEIKLDSINYWKEMSIQLAHKFNQKHLAQSLKENGYEIKRVSEKELLLNIRDDNDEDNLFYDGVKVHLEGQNIVVVEMGKYFN